MALRTATALALALTRVATAGAQGSSSPPARALVHPPAAHRVTRAWPVMGTMFTATAWGADTTALLAMIRDARDSVRLVDSLMSNYRESSEITAANRAAGAAAPVAVSAQTFHVLTRARTYWRLSEGAFDPTVGPLVGAWGFYGDSGAVPPRRTLDSLRALVGFAAVELDSARRTVRLPRAGMRLDLGGIAKGYALDLARAALRDSRVRGGSLDLGGNVLVFGRPPRGVKWVVGIAHPRRGGRVLGRVALDSGAVATSGDYEHFFRIGGVRYAHLIDPRTGRPARGVIAATAIGPTGEWSDGLSATLFLADARRAVALADSLPGVAALYVREPARGSVVRRRDVVLSARARRWFAWDRAMR